MEFNYTESWSYLLQGRIMDAALYPYVHLMGNIFYALIGFMAMTMIYFKTNNYGTTGIAGLIMAGVAVAYLPEYTRYAAMIFAALGIVLILYRVFKKPSAY